MTPKPPLPPGNEREVLTPECMAFVADLTRRYGPRVAELLAARRAMQTRYDAGYRPRFLPETRAIRESSWTVAPLPRTFATGASRSPAPSTAR